jgi:hypothetical protein
MKIWLSTPSFCKAKLLEESLEHIYKTPPKRPFTHWVIDNHYPVNKAENSEKMKEICKKFGCIYIDSGKDLGLHGGLNNAMKQVNLKPGDILIGSDADDRPSPGFLDEMAGAMMESPDFAILAAMFWVIDQRMKEGVLRVHKTPSGRTILVHPNAEMFCIAAFNTRIVNQELPFEQLYAYYGGIECALYGRWIQKGMKLGYLPEVRADVVPLNRDDPTLFDPEYRQWKTDHVGGYKGSFEEWLQEKCPDRLQI